MKHKQIIIISALLIGIGALFFTKVTLGEEPPPESCKYLLASYQANMDIYVFGYCLKWDGFRYIDEGPVNNCVPGDDPCDRWDCAAHPLCTVAYPS